MSWFDERGEWFDLTDEADLKRLDARRAARPRPAGISAARRRTLRRPPDRYTAADLSASNDGDALKAL